MGCNCSAETLQERFDVQPATWPRAHDSCPGWSVHLDSPVPWEGQVEVAEQKKQKADAEQSHTSRKWSVGSDETDLSLLSLSRVAAGHGGTSILKYVERSATVVPETPLYVMKVWDDVEANVYQELKATNDALLPFTPAFFGEVDAADISPGLSSRYMRLSNVLHEFKPHPNVMDCKIGIRSFTEAEVGKTKLREDLFKKLVKLDPSAPTPEEREAGACTKYRWMSQNDARSTLGNLGFRIDGIETSAGKIGTNDLRQLTTISDIADRISEEFLPADMTASASLSTCDTDDELEAVISGFTLGAAEQLLKQLQNLREALLASEFVKTHSFIGCSLLFVADACGSSAGVYLIDFAHTTRLPAGIRIDHRSPWKAGNHEDGLLLGLDNMIECWESIVMDYSSSCNTKSW